MPATPPAFPARPERLPKDVPPLQRVEPRGNAAGEALQIRHLLERVREELESAVARTDTLIQRDEVLEDRDLLRQALHLQARLDFLLPQVAGSADVLESFLRLLPLQAVGVPPTSR